MTAILLLVLLSAVGAWATWTLAVDLGRPTTELDMEKRLPLDAS